MSDWSEAQCPGVKIGRQTSVLAAEPKQAPKDGHVLHSARPNRNRDKE